MWLRTPKGQAPIFRNLLIFETKTCISHLWEGQRDHSTDEVHHNQMEDRVSEEEVGKGSFWGDGQEISFVLWVDLDAKTNCQAKKKKSKETCQKILSHPGQREIWTVALILHYCLVLQVHALKSWMNLTTAANVPSATGVTHICQWKRVCKHYHTERSTDHFTAIMPITPRSNQCFSKITTDFN